MSSNASIARGTLEWRLVRDCLIQMEAYSGDGRYHFSMHHVHSLFRDGNLSASEHSEHVRHPEIIAKKLTAGGATSLYLRGMTNGDTTQYLEMPSEIDFPQGFDEGPQMKVKLPEGTWKTLERLPLPKVGALSQKKWFLVCADMHALLFRATPAQPHTEVAYSNLNGGIGNKDGNFDFESHSFLDSARNVKLDGQELSADLRDLNGEWKTRSLNVKEHVHKHLMVGDPNYAPFDDLRNFPDRGPPLAVEWIASSLKTPLYSSLSKERRQIRLCKILPGKWNDPIEISLIFREDESNLAYECLSYVWGSRSDSIQILVDGHVFNATVNLWSALQQLRFRGNDKPIWIDAICINQQDNVEKSWQVAIMGAIYSQADNVVAYFGSIESLHRRVDEHSPVPDILSFEVFCRHQADRGHLRFVPGLFEPFTDGKPTDGPQSRNIISWLRAIRAHPWWSRVWTLQELILPEKLTCLFGPVEIEWSMLLSAAGTSQLHSRTCGGCIQVYSSMAPEILDVFQSWADNICLLGHCRQIYRQTNLADPVRWNATLTLLSQAQCRSCFDERDKVFGLLAMLPPSPDAVAAFIPDYGASVEKVYIDFTLNIITASASLGIWDLVSSKAPTGIKGEAFPSWAVDWRIRNSSPGFEMVEVAKIIISRFTFAAPVRLPLEILDSGKLLVVEGTKVDVLQAVSQSAWPTRSLDTRAEFARVLKEWMAMIERLSGREYVLGGEVWNAFWKTMLYDHALGYESGQLILGRAGDEDKGIWEEWSTMVLSEPGEGESTVENNGRQSTLPSMVASGLLEVASGRKLFVTRKGLIGIGPANAQPGDECFALRSGTYWLYLLRPSLGSSDQGHRADSKSFNVVGPAYVHGMMDERRDELLENTTKINVE